MRSVILWKLRIVIQAVQNVFNHAQKPSSLSRMPVLGRIYQHINMSFIEENSTLPMTLSTEMELLSKSSPSVVELTQELMEYKISIYIFTYATVPVAIWGWMGNFLSFR